MNYSNHIGARITFCGMPGTISKRFFTWIVIDLDNGRRKTVNPDDKRIKLV